MTALLPASDAAFLLLQLDGLCRTHAARAAPPIPWLPRRWCTVTLLTDQLLAHADTLINLDADLLARHLAGGQDLPVRWALGRCPPPRPPHRRSE